MRCDHCGAAARSGTERCAYCGSYFPVSPSAPAAAPPPEQPPVVVHVYNTVQSPFDPRGPLKSRWTAFFLCLFVGWLGVHRFYLGKAGTGLLYLFSGGLFGVGWAVDLLLLLLGVSRDKWGRRLA